MLDDRTILVTGGTGSFGRRFVRHVITKHKPRKVIIYSRDEYKQYHMRKDMEQYDGVLRFFLGDVRDESRLRRAFQDVDYVVHAAALKQVPALEYNPTEAVNTNVSGADNIINAAIDTGVRKVVALSTDKAVNPANLYGATKLVAEKLFIAANAYGGRQVAFSVVRYGNVMGSRGSIIPLLLDLRRRGVREVPITDGRMTRFWITLDESVELVMKSLAEAQGGEIYVPRIPSMKIVDLARAVDPECHFKTIGIRPGEKLHEALLSQDEARTAKSFGDIYVVMPQFQIGDRTRKKYEDCSSLPEGFAYTSDTNESWIGVEEMRERVKRFEDGF